MKTTTRRRPSPTQAYPSRSGNQKKRPSLPSKEEQVAVHAARRHTVATTLAALGLSIGNSIQMAGVLVVTHTLGASTETAIGVTIVAFLLSLPCYYTLYQMTWKNPETYMETMPAVILIFAFALGCIGAFVLIGAILYEIFKDKRFPSWKALRLRQMSFVEHCMDQTPF